MISQIKQKIKQKDLFQPCPIHEGEYLNIVCIDVLCMNNGIICRRCQSSHHKAHGWFTLEDFTEQLVKQEKEKIDLFKQEQDKLQNWQTKVKNISAQLQEILMQQYKQERQVKLAQDQLFQFNESLKVQIDCQISLCQQNSSIAVRIKENKVLNAQNLQEFMKRLIQDFHLQYKPINDNLQLENLNQQVLRYINKGKYLSVQTNHIFQSILELKRHIPLIDEKNNDQQKQLLSLVKLDNLDKKCAEIHISLKEIFEQHLKEKHQEILVQQIKNWNYLYEIKNQPREFEWWLWYGENPLQNDVCKVCEGLYQTNRVYLHQLDRERRQLIQDIFDKQ